MKELRELIPYIGPIPILIPLKLFLEGIELPADSVTSCFVWKPHGGGIQKHAWCADECKVRGAFSSIFTWINRQSGYGRFKT